MKLKFILIHQSTFVMEPKIFEQISTKIAELKALLDSANAQAMTPKEVQGQQKLSAKLYAQVSSILQTLQVSKPTLYADRINRQELTDLVRTYDAIPDLIRDLNTCIKKAQGWRISTGQRTNAIMLRLYRLLGADVPDMPDLRQLYDSLAAIFKLGKRKPKPGSENSDNTGSSDNSDSSDDSSAGSDKPTA